MLKKVISCFLVLCTIVSLCGCGSTSPEAKIVKGAKKEISNSNNIRVKDYVKFTGHLINEGYERWLERDTYKNYYDTHEKTYKFIGIILKSDDKEYCVVYDIDNDEYHIYDKEEVNDLSRIEMNEIKPYQTFAIYYYARPSHLKNEYPKAFIEELSGGQIAALNEELK